MLCFLKWRNDVHRIGLENFSSDEAAINFCIALFERSNGKCTGFEIWDERELIYRYASFQPHQA
jgi:hypothetical protein